MDDETRRIVSNKRKVPKKWINDGNNFDNYLQFTDNYFWKCLGEIVTKPKIYYAPNYIIKLCEKLLNHEELPFIENSEVRIISKNTDDIKNTLLDSDIYKQYILDDDKIVLSSVRPITKHVTIDEFTKCIKENIPEEMADDKDQYIKNKMLARFMEGICVCNQRDDSIHLLCDDDKSLMKQLYGTNLIIYRAFEFKV